MHFRKVRVFYNHRSGPARTRFHAIRQAISSVWNPLADEIAWYFPASREESSRFLKTALAEGTDCVLIAGGDGTISSIGAELIGTGVPMGVIPLGSGNGLARHFEQSLSPVKSLSQLASGKIREIDVATVNGHPFLVSASIAWDAALVNEYNALPMRGVFSYVLAAGVSFLEYKPQPLTLMLDDTEKIDIDHPILCTIGNLSGWGGGALIDALASAEDGILELIAGRRRDAAAMLSQLPKVFAGAGTKDLPGVIYRKLKKLSIIRGTDTPIQLDGELVSLGANLTFEVSPKKLRLITPLQEL